MNNPEVLSEYKKETIVLVRKEFDRGVKAFSLSADQSKIALLLIRQKLAIGDPEAGPVMEHGPVYKIRSGRLTEAGKALLTELTGPEPA